MQTLLHASARHFIEKRGDVMYCVLPSSEQLLLPKFVLVLIIGQNEILRQELSGII